MVHMQHKSEIKQSTSLLAVLAEQTKKRPVTVDDETFKKGANPQKKKEIQRSEEGKRSKTLQTESFTHSDKLKTSQTNMF